MTHFFTFYKGLFATCFYKVIKEGVQKKHSPLLGKILKPQVNFLLQ